MLREYEKVKNSIIIQECDQEEQQQKQNKSSDRISKKDKSMRVTKSTFNHQKRDVKLLRMSDGLPLSKLRPRHQFIPINPVEGKQAIKNDNFALFQEEYDLKRQCDFQEHLNKKSKFVAGIFRHSYYNDNSSVMNSTNQSFSQTRMRMTGQSFINEQNNYQTFLNEKQEIPRLSILQNYKQIMRVMTSNYLKSLELEKRYKNIEQVDAKGDEEYQQFKEDEVNAKKMTTILKSLNSPKRGTQQNFFKRDKNNSMSTERKGTNLNSLFNNTQVKNQSCVGNNIYNIDLNLSKQ